MCVLYCVCTVAIYYFKFAGNWAPTSYPHGDTFLPYGDPNWQKANRDMLVKMKSQSVVDDFYKVFYEDWKRGTEWSPPPPNCDAITEECG